MIARHLSHLLVSSRHWDIETTCWKTFDHILLYIVAMQWACTCSAPLDMHALWSIAWLKRARKALWGQTNASWSLGDTWHCSPRLPTNDISICHLQRLTWSPTLSSQAIAAAGFKILLIVTTFSFAPPPQNDFKLETLTFCAFCVERRFSTVLRLIFLFF